MKLSIKVGATSVSLGVFIQDSSSTTGAGLTGLAFNTASLTCYAVVPGSSAAAITLATLAAANSAWSSGGFKEIDATNMPGWYRFDVPNTNISTGRSVGIHFKGATNMAPLALEIELTGWDNQSATDGGLSKLTSLTFTVAAQADVNVIDWKGAAAPAMTGDAFARLGAPAGASVSADIAAAKVDTAAIKTKTDSLAFTVANQVDSNVIDWKGAAAPAMTGDAFARLGAPAGASVSADVAAVKVDSAAIKAKTDSLTFTVATQADVNVKSFGGTAGTFAAGRPEIDLNSAAETELTAVPASTAKLKDMLKWLFLLSRNKVTQTATTQLVRNNADGATVGTSTVSDDGTTFTRDKFS